MLPRRLLAFAAALALLSACTPGEAAPAPDSEPPAGAAATAPEGQAQVATLRWAIAEPSAIEPHRALDRPGLDVVDLLFDSLTEVEADGSLEPAAALAWRSRDAGREWSFDLDPEARFHDGAPVTTADVVRGWEGAVRAGLPHLRGVEGAAALRRGAATTLRGLHVVDDHTLTVRLSAPDTAFPAVVAHPSLAPLHRLASATTTGAPSFATHPIGNGPFAMAEPWARGRFIRLERVTGGEHDVREVVFETTDPSTGYIRFQQGRVHVASVPAGALEESLARYGAAPRGSTAPGVRRDPLPVLVHLGMDVTRPPFDAVEVRQALSLAVDRAALVEAVAEGNAQPARSLVPPAVVPLRDEVCGTCVHNPAMARELFAAAGVDELTMTVESGAGDEALVRQLHADLAAAGVDLAVRRLPFDELLDELEAGEVALARLGWVTELPDVLSAVEPLVRSGVPEPGAGVSYGGYGDPEVDQLLDEARGSADVRRRDALARAAERIALGRDQAVVPLYTARRRLVVDTRVSGLALSPFGGLDLAEVRLDG